MRRTVKYRRHVRFGYYLMFLILLSVALFGWWQGSSQDLGSVSDRLMAVGRLFGILAAFSVLVELLLMARLPAIDHYFDLQQIVDAHRLNGYSILFFISAHVVVLLVSYSQPTNLSLLDQFVEFNTSYQHVLLASIGTAILVAAGALSVKLVRSRLPYEAWYATHLLMYVAIGLTFLHQVPVGGDFMASTWFGWFWYGLFAAVGLLWLGYRVLRPWFKLWRHQFRVHSVVPITHDTFSVFVTGQSIGKFRFEPGQYADWRILAPGLWLQAHPFSISSPYNNTFMRFTVKVGGDYTRRLAQVKPGTPVLVDGPRGSFGAERAEQAERVVLIAGGIGVAPFLSTANTLLAEGKQVTLLYAVKTFADAAFLEELKRLQGFGLVVLLYVADQHYRITPEVLAAHVAPNSTYYICGPDGMTLSFMQVLKQCGVADKQIITERFAM